MNGRVNRRDFLKANLNVAGAYAFASVAKGFADGAPKNPNILFLITDQQTIGALSSAGNPYVKTPNMDRLAARGMRFEKSYCTYPLCSPSRASLFTSRMPHELGVYSNRNSPRLPTDVPSMGTLLRQAGYETAYAGKWHLPYVVPAYGKLDWQKTIPGFDVLPETGQLAQFSDSLISKGLLIDPPAASAAVDFLHAAPKQPFLLVASILNPHDICAYGNAKWKKDFAQLENEEPPPPLLPNFNPDGMEPSVVRHLQELAHDWSDDEWCKYRAVYYRLVETADRLLGQVLDALDQAGLTDSTIIIFTSDHGEMMGAHHLTHKQYFYEESVAVPMIVCVPGITEHASVDAAHLVSGLDILPTMLDYAGVAVPNTLEGRSLRPLIEGRTTVWRDHLVGEVGETDEVYRARMVRTDRYKYIVFAKGKRPEQLFDEQTDPGEMKNLVDDPASKSVLEHHRLLLRNWIHSTTDEFAMPGSP